MKTLKHELLGEEIDLPEETEGHAKEFFSMINADENDVNLMIKMGKSDYFNGMPSFLQANLVEKAVQLKKSKSKSSQSKYKDEIYLEMGVYDLSTIIDRGLDNLEKAVDETLNDIYKDRRN